MDTSSRRNRPPWQWCLTDVLLPGLFFLAACQGYQVEPYVEYQYRDENLGSHQPSSRYDGSTVGGGLRWKAPTQLAETQLVRLEGAIRSRVGGQPIQLPANPIIIDHKDQAEEDFATKLVDRGLSVETWTGVAGLFAVALILWIWRRRRVSSAPTSSDPAPDQ